MKLIITKIFKFDSAHNLINYNGACEKIHGHTYNLEISVIGEKKEDGMLLDFVILKKIVKEKIISKLDHLYINELIEQPTAENIVEWIWNQLENDIKKNKAELYQIKLFEGPNSFVTLTK